MFINIILWSLLLTKISLLEEEDHVIDSINISAVVTDFINNTNNTSSEVINFTVTDPRALELSNPENLITLNYVSTFLLENLSDDGEVVDKVYTVEEVHDEEDGITKLSLTDPHR